MQANRVKKLLCKLNLPCDIRKAFLVHMSEILNFKQTLKRRRKRRRSLKNLKNIKFGYWYIYLDKLSLLSTLKRKANQYQHTHEHQKLNVLKSESWMCCCFLISCTGMASLHSRLSWLHDLGNYIKRSSDCQHIGQSYHRLLIQLP